VETIEEKGKQLDFSRNISIWIDTYDDIFSDFDPRLFSERNISDDFLNELRKVSREDNFHVNEFRLLVPEKNRNQETETIISKHLHAFFRKNVHACQQQVTQLRTKGFLFVIISVFLLMGASYISSLKSENIFMHVLLVLLEPAGWFLIWRGLDNLISSSRQEMPELDFYNKMVKSKIVFVSISGQKEESNLLKS
jgi:hypothetical protein